MTAPDANIGPDLTNREQQVVGEIAWGRTNGEIASRLGLSELTVKSHLARISARLGASGRAGIVGLAFKDGWIAWKNGQLVFPRWNAADEGAAAVRRIRPRAGEPDVVGNLRRAFALADSRNSGARPK
jgi:DNA-binding CsgD family transcriptional regulator